MKLETYDKIEARTRTCELRDIDNHYHHRSQKKHHLFRSESPSFRFINVSGSLKGIYLFSSSLIFVWPTVLIILPMQVSRNILFIKPPMSRTPHKRSTYPIASSHRISYIRYIHRVNNRTRSLEENRNHQLICVFNRRSCGFRPNRCTCRSEPTPAMGSSVSRANLNSDKSRL